MMGEMLIMIKILFVVIVNIINILCHKIIIDFTLSFPENKELETYTNTLSQFDK